MNCNQFYSNQSQVYWTCKALLDGRTISHKTEIRDVRGWGLGAIVHRLKSDYAWPIQTEYRCPENVAYYSMNPDFDKSVIRFPRSARSLGDGEAA